MKIRCGWRCMAGVVSAFVVAFVTTATYAGEPRCRGNPHIVARCYWIQGEFAMSADSAFIVDREDNGQWVIIRSPKDWPDVGPANLEHLYDKLVRARGLAAAVVRGRFEVCPISKATADDPVHACIQSATHLQRISRDWMSPAQKRLHDQGVAAFEKDQARAVARQKKLDAAAAARRLEHQLGITPP